MVILLIFINNTGFAVQITKPEIIKGDYNSIESYIHQLVLTKMKSLHITGLSIALVDEQKLIWTQNFGYADLAAKIPVTSDTLFRVGSISKLFYGDRNYATS